MIGEKRSDSIPSYMQERMGKMGVMKGKTDDGAVSLYSWDAVAECEVENCPAYLNCPYQKEGKCHAQVQYLKAVTSIVFNNFDEITEPQLYRVGMHLVPLYKTLCRMKLEEIGTTSVAYTDSKGNRKVNPIFREIRETIKVIELTWKSIGLDRIMAESMPTDPFDEKEEEGNYYEEMAGEADRHGQQPTLVTRRSK